MQNVDSKYKQIAEMLITKRYLKLIMTMHYVMIVNQKAVGKELNKIKIKLKKCNHGFITYISIDKSFAVCGECNQVMYAK